jgi:hypothetical protein
MTAKISKEYAERLVGEHGYELLDMYVKNEETRIILQDWDGYKYDVSIHNFISRNGGELRAFDPRNPFVLENISLWLFLNEKPFRLSKNQKEYSGSKDKLEFVCDNDGCQRCFYIDWSHVYSRGYGCYYCSGKVPTETNNFGYAYPKLVSEWSRKNEFSPYEYSPKSGEHVDWICEKGHEWNSSIGNRANGCGCPVCNGLIAGYDDNLLFLRPEIAAEWHPTLNGDARPEEFRVGSNQYAWWKCSNCGNEWETKIHHRTLSGSGCKRCGSSKGEDVVYETLIKFGFVENGDFFCEHSFDECKNKKNLYFDFYLPNYNLCVEYNGKQHYEMIEFFGGKQEFKNMKKRDKIKQDYCYNNNINLLIIPYWDFDNIEQILYDILKQIELDQQL